MANGRPWWMDDPEIIAIRAAVLAARKAGLSWAEIGRLLGTSRQQVHRQFHRRLAD